MADKKMKTTKKITPSKAPPKKDINKKMPVGAPDVKARANVPAKVAATTKPAAPVKPLEKLPEPTKATPAVPVESPVRAVEAPPDVVGMAEKLKQEREGRLGDVQREEIGQIIREAPVPEDKKAEAAALWDTIAEAGERAQPPGEDEDPDETNTTHPQEVQQVRKEIGGLFGTDPPPVREAEPYKDPSFISKALGYPASAIPIVGGLLSQPLLRQYQSKTRRVEKDKEVDAMFWKAMDEDPLYAKQLSRVPFVRDALQRYRQMDGDEILELDRSITEEGVVSRKHLKTLLDQGLRPEGGFKTEFGTLKTPAKPSKFVETKDGLIMDETTGEYSRPQNVSRWDETAARVRKAFPDISPEDEFLTTMAIMSPAAARSKMIKTDEGLYMYDRFTDKGRTIKMPPGAKSPMFMGEVIKTDGFTEDGIILWNKNARTEEEAQKHSTIVMFRDILDKQSGRTLKDYIEDAKTEGGGGQNMVNQLIQKFLGYFSVEDRYPAGTQQVRVQGQAQPGRQPGQATPVSPPPKQGGMLGTNELEKSNTFFSEALGD